MERKEYMPKRPYPVGTKIPLAWKEFIDQHLVGCDKEYTTYSEYVRELIRKDLKERGFF